MYIWKTARQASEMSYNERAREIRCLRKATTYNIRISISPSYNVNHYIIAVVYGYVAVTVVIQVLKFYMMLRRGVCDYVGSASCY